MSNPTDNVTIATTPGHDAVCDCNRCIFDRIEIRERRQGERRATARTTPERRQREVTSVADLPAALGTSPPARHPGTLGASSRRDKEVAAMATHHAGTLHPVRNPIDPDEIIMVDGDGVIAGYISGPMTRTDDPASLAAVALLADQGQPPAEPPPREPEADERPLSHAREHHATEALLHVIVDAGEPPEDLVLANGEGILVGRVLSRLERMEEPPAPAPEYGDSELAEKLRLSERRAVVLLCGMRNLARLDDDRPVPVMKEILADTLDAYYAVDREASASTSTEGNHHER